MSKDGDFQIAVYGLARVISDDLFMSTVGTQMYIFAGCCTDLSFMDPEIRSGIYSQSVDIFSLGVTLRYW